MDTGATAVVPILPNAVTLQHFLMCGDPQPENHFIATS